MQLRAFDLGDSILTSPSVCMTLEIFNHKEQLRWESNNGECLSYAFPVVCLVGYLNVIGISLRRAQLDETLKQFRPRCPLLRLSLVKTMPFCVVVTATIRGCASVEQLSTTALRSNNFIHANHLIDDRSGNMARQKPSEIPHNKGPEAQPSKIVYMNEQRNIQTSDLESNHGTTRYKQSYHFIQDAACSCTSAI